MTPLPSGHSGAGCHGGLVPPCLLPCLVLTTLLLLPSPATPCEYDDCHSTGAVSKPGGWDIRLPFEAGEHVQVLSGYGPNNGSSLHCRAQDSLCANDYHALDFVLPDHPNWGKGQPVVAIADGVVWHSGWASGGWEAYGLRAYVLHDNVGDGHQYVSMYAHLNDLFVSDGQLVSQGQLIGELGGSCNGDYECGNFSTPHLHFSIHRDSSYGGTGSGGSYGGRATVPEPFDGYTGIQQWDDLYSNNGGGPGDDDDDTGDDDDDDVNGCEIAVSGSTRIEEDGPCAQRVGDPGQYEDHDGSGGHSWWVLQNEPDPDYGLGVNWMFEFVQGGEYDLWAHVPAGLSDLTADADYKVFFAGGASQHVHVSQAAAAGHRVHLGAFTFDAGGDQWVRLGDNYADAVGPGSKLALDALELAPVEACDCDVVGDVEARPCDNGGVQIRTCDGCHWSEWTECSDPGDDDDTAAGDDDDGPDGPGGATGGCGCRAGGLARAGWAPLALALALALRRRSPRRQPLARRGMLG